MHQPHNLSDWRINLIYLIIFDLFVMSSGRKRRILLRPLFASLHIKYVKVCVGIRNIDNLNATLQSI